MSKTFTEPTDVTSAAKAAELAAAFDETSRGITNLCDEIRGYIAVMAGMHRANHLFNHGEDLHDGREWDGGGNATDEDRIKQAIYEAREAKGMVIQLIRLIREMNQGKPQS